MSAEGSGYSEQQELKRIEQKIERRLNWLRDAQRAELDQVTQMRLPETQGSYGWRIPELQGFLDLEVPIRQMDQSDVEAVVFLGKVGVGISGGTPACKTDIDL